MKPAGKRGAHGRRTPHATRRTRSGLLLAAVIAVLAALSSPAAAHAQQYFGQNQVQYDRFEWRIKETDHFLIYYYPEEKDAVTDAARMAERAYARLSRILDHQFREKKPLVLFASRNDFGQNNVTGDLGETTGGVTEALRHRMLLNFTGDYRTFEHVLAHEMVHAFQYDIFARGKAGAGLQTLQQYMPPLWFAEGMAEYLSLGPSTPMTNMWMRDAALNGKLPTIEQLTYHPARYFPYRYGHAFWTYVGQRWGDEAIGQIMHAVPGVGVERAIKRELGISLEELGEEWKESLQTQHLPQVASLDRVRKVAQPILTKRKSGGEVFLAPSLSNDGQQIAFFSNGSFFKGEVFIDLWLANAHTGKRTKRLVKSTTNPDFEELRLLYSQSAFSPDGKYLAFTAQRRGKDVLYLMDLKKGKTVRRFDLPLEGVTGPSFSPDGRRLVFSGSRGGITDLFMVNADGSDLQRLTDDKFGDLQPAWSPDGKRIAWASDRGDEEGFRVLKIPHFRIAVLDLERGAISVLPGQAGLNINPTWAPDSRSLAFVSDRTGIANIFLYDFTEREHYQLTNVVGGITGATEVSPAISWAAKADRMAVTYFEDNAWTIWGIQNPRALKKTPFREPVAAPVVAQTPLSSMVGDLATRTGLQSADPVRQDGGAPPPASPAPESGVAAAERRSTYRSGTDLRPSAEVPASGDRAFKPPVTVAMLLDSAEMALPDTTKFRDAEYRVRFQPDYIARPSIGYAPGGGTYGQNVFGGTTVVLSDMLGNNRLAFAGEINGRVAESRVYAGYTKLGGRFQLSTGLSQSPYYFLTGDSLTPISGDRFREDQEITTYISRQLFSVGAYPINRFSRVEFGMGLSSVARKKYFIWREVVGQTAASRFERDSTRNESALNYADAQAAYVSDNTLFGYTGPIYGRRMRFQVSPVLGSFQWMEYLADYRRYDPILFNFLTVATRVYANMSVGRDELKFPKYIARPDFVRGYDRSNSFYFNCQIVGSGRSNCSAVQLLGSRVAVANAELRFPLVRQLVLGPLPIGLPPVEGVFFYDMGVAWSKDQSVYWQKPVNFDVATQRHPLRSYGFGVRVNLFNYAMLRWDYAVPLDSPSRKGFWTWSLWPGF